MTVYGVDRLTGMTTKCVTGDPGACGSHVPGTHTASASPEDVSAENERVCAMRAIQSRPVTARVMRSGATFVLCSDLEEWHADRARTPGATDIAFPSRLLSWRPNAADRFSSEMLMDKSGRPTFLSRIFEFGHEYEPMILSSWAGSQGLHPAGKDVPVDDLKPGEYSWNDDSYYVQGGEDGTGGVHASLDGVARLQDGSVIVIEVKTGGRADLDALKTEQRRGYIRQAVAEKMIVSADRAIIVYARRPHGFILDPPETTREQTLASVTIVDVDAERIRDADIPVTVDGRDMMWPSGVPVRVMEDVMGGRSTMTVHSAVPATPR